MTTNVHTIYPFGALRVILDSVTGAVVAVLCRTSLVNAEGRFSQPYIDAAARAAVQAWASTADE